jgi:epsilon-lactone hydrolase
MRSTDGLFNLKEPDVFTFARFTRMVFAELLLCFSLFAAFAQSDDPKALPKIGLGTDGTVDVPPRTVPISEFLSPEAKAYVAEHLYQMQHMAEFKGKPGVPGFMMHYYQRDQEAFALNTKDERIGGIHVYDFISATGVVGKNRNRVLINLHGGGFTGCWPGCAELESRPIASLMGIRVITIDYREGPNYKFPAASEDVAKVYQELLKHYKARNIGIYGCSAGGMLTAMSLAWFQTHNLPMPGADGIFCASAGKFGGDANYIAYPLGEARIPAVLTAQNHSGYFSDANMDDPLVTPTNSKAILAKFPPTLLITATRDFAMSGALDTNIQLSKAGVITELFVWDGLFHGFFYDSDIPESKDAFNIMIRFFDRYLGK